MCKGLRIEHRFGIEPDMQPVIDYVNSGPGYHYHVGTDGTTVPGEGWVGDPPFGSYEESYADVHPVTGEAREMTDPPFVCYHLDTCDIGHCAPGCPCTHVKIGKEERSPWARPIEEKKMTCQPHVHDHGCNCYQPITEEKVMETNEDNSPQSVAWSEVSRALECLSIDTARAIRVEMDQQYVFVTEFARDANGRFLSDDDVTLVTKTTRYEIDLAR